VDFGAGLISFFKSIPDVVWSGMLASTLTLGGILIADRNNTGRLRLQLKHDADEKSKERIAVLRRDVYLRTIEELNKANAHLATLPAIDFSKSNFVEGLSGFFSASAQLQLVAEPKTALLVNKLSAKYSELGVKLLPYVMSVAREKSNMEIASKFRSDERVEIDRILVEMRKLNESGNPNPAIFEVLRRSADFHHEQAKKYSEEQDIAWEKFNAGSLALYRYVIEEFKQISELQFPVMIEVRRDLGLGTGDLADLEHQMRAQWDRMTGLIDVALSQLAKPDAKH
jgi:hypothetical protein